MIEKTIIIKEHSAVIILGRGSKSRPGFYSPGCRYWITGRITNRNNDVIANLVCNDAISDGQRAMWVRVAQRGERW